MAYVRAFDCASARNLNRLLCALCRSTVPCIRSNKMMTELATFENFSELGYLLANPDVAQEVLRNPLVTGFIHFSQFGKNERRMQFKPAMSDVEIDRALLDNGVPSPNKLIDAHRNQRDLCVELGNKKGMRVLEIGSREVTGASSLRERLTNATYVGFDYYPGPNVDVMGDAHQLSRHFGEGEKFDLVYSSAVFEHLAMPWVVAEEISKVLKVGGILFVETHFSFSSHERPWHFFQFSDMGLRALFSPALGFECIEATMANPISGRFSMLADPYLRGRWVHGLYCHSQYLGVKRREVEPFAWRDVALDVVVGDTFYPTPV